MATIALARQLMHRHYNKETVELRGIEARSHDRSSVLAWLYLPSNSAALLRIRRNAPHRIQRNGESL